MSLQKINEEATCHLRAFTARHKCTFTERKKKVERNHLSGYMYKIFFLLPARIIADISARVLQGRGFC